MTNNSSRSRQGKNLAIRLESFLVNLANLKTGERFANGHNYAGAERLLRLYRDFFPATFPHQSALSKLGDESNAKLHRDAILTEPRTDEEREQESLHHLFDLSYRLRCAWDEPDVRRKEWLLFEVRRAEHIGVYCGTPNDPPDWTLFEQAMFHLQGIAERAKHCPNSDCPAPYFIAPKRRYKFCSPACALPAQQRNKRDWWAKHGEKWRQDRKRASEKSKRKGSHAAKTR